MNEELAVPSETKKRVSGREALARALTGIGYAVVALSLVGLLWPDMLEGSAFVLALFSVVWLHEEEDRRSTVAAVAAGVLSLVIVVSASMVFGKAWTDLSRHVLYAASGVVPGSQLYAAITRRGL